MKVYLVVFEWSDEIGSDTDIEVFDSYEKAVIRFQERIDDEKTYESWIHDAFDEDGDVLDGYDFDECRPNTRLETYAYWNIADPCNWRMHDYIAIVPQEVK